MLAKNTQPCLDAAPPGTRIVLLGLATENVIFNPLRFVRQELEIRNTFFYEHPTDYPGTIALITSCKLSLGATASEPQPLLAPEGCGSWQTERQTHR